MGWFRRRLAAAKADDGLTLVELIVTFVIFAIISAGLLAMASTSYALAAHNRNRVIASGLAARQIDIVRATDPTKIVLNETTTTQVVNGTTYTIVQNTAPVGTTNSGSACTASGPSPTAIELRTTVSVTWPHMGDVSPVLNSTIDAPKAGTLNSTNGNVGVSVVDRNGKPLEGITVQAPAGSSGGVTGTSAVTGADGCAFFLQLGTGAYTPWLSTAGYVNTLGVAQPSSTVTLTSGNTSSLSFTYDKASGLVLSTDATATYPAPTNMPFTLYNTNYTNSTQTQIFTGTGYPRTISNLFPATSGYVAWGGSCTDADPKTKRIAAVSMTPGSNSTGTVHVFPIQINPTFTTTSTAGAWKVVATHAADTGSGCTSGESYTITSSTSAPMLFSLPYGKWSFVATSSKGSSTATSQTFSATTTGTTTFGLVMP